jgi:GTP-binding protein EngB required for normal cell division
MREAAPIQATSETSTWNRALPQIVGRVEEIEARYGLKAIRPYIDACKAVLTQKDTIDVGIFGRFKAGKSSLLNYIAGTAVLPVGVTPVTAVVTRLRFGPVIRAIVEYFFARSKEVAVSSVKSFISESENPENRKKVARVDIELPSLDRYAGLQFVDTPGLDSVFEHNTETALNWLPKAGLALVAISADTPLSKQDLMLIRALRGYTPRIAIVMTKADLLTANEIAEISSFMGNKLHAEFDADFSVVPFSIRPEYGDLRSAFENKVFGPLRASRESVRTDIVSYKFDALLNQTHEYLALALAAAERAEADRSRLRDLILDERTSYESIRMDLQALATECVSHTRPWIMKRMSEIRPEISERVTLELSEMLKTLRGNLWKLSRSYEQRLEEVVVREMRGVSQREGYHFCHPLENATLTLSRSEQGFRDRLASNIEQVLGIRFTPGPPQIEIEKPSVPDTSFSNLSMFNTDLLWFVIPMVVFRPWVERHLIGRIPWEIEKNLSRIASQWTEGINKAIFKMQHEASKRVRDQIATVESSLSRSQSEVAGIRSVIEEIESIHVSPHSYDGDSDQSKPGCFPKNTAVPNKEKS